MSFDTDFLHRHGWRIAGSETRNCKKTPLWRKTGVLGLHSTTEAVERQRQGRTTQEMSEARANTRVIELP